MDDVQSVTNLSSITSGFVTGVKYETAYFIATEMVPSHGPGGVGNRLYLNEPPLGKLGPTPKALRQLQLIAQNAQIASLLVQF